MLLKVVSVVDHTRGTVDARFLEQLIKAGTITAFKRRSGWVNIGVHPIRRSNCAFAGQDRRKIDQYPE